MKVAGLCLLNCPSMAATSNVLQKVNSFKEYKNTMTSQMCIETSST